MTKVNDPIESPMLVAYTKVIRFIYPLAMDMLERPDLEKHRLKIHQLQMRYDVGSDCSPLFDSFFSLWSLFDAQYRGQTLGERLLPLIREQDELIADIVEVLNNSYLGVYSFEGHHGSKVTLRDLFTNETCCAVNQSGYQGQAEEIWLTRLLQTHETATVAISSPYVANGDSAPWLSYLRENGVIPGDIESYKAFMKCGDWIGYICKHVEGIHKEFIQISPPKRKKR